VSDYQIMRTKPLLPYLIKPIPAFTVFLFAFVMSSGVFAQQSGVSISANGSPPHESAGFEVNFTDKGLLPPRLTEAQRDEIINPALGLVIFNISTNCLNYFVGNDWYAVCGIPSIGTIATLDCADATLSGILTEGVEANGVLVEIPYTGGNGGPHLGQTVNSTGVTGLTATLATGSFNLFPSTISYGISGTPNTSGTANFAIEIGGKSCTLEVAVLFPCGVSDVTFTYYGSPVTYGTVERLYGGAVGRKCWLDRNLGASQVATSSADVNSYGDLFQWGRLIDGHQIRTSVTTTTLSDSDNPGNANFIIINSGNYDWRNPQNDNLWQGIGGINNPCPIGWRLPTLEELDAERASWGSNNAAGAYASPLKLPATGIRIRSTGAIQDAGSRGDYWSSTISDVDTRTLYYTGSSAFMNTDSRAFGAAVRCIRD